ncbi:MAG: cell division protein FtsQ/DivIB [Hydrogenophaga sp.]|jgi:cell division protein FtsQ|nr:cell division protein FtsQ/DivIB [Hydrogenophaga sp.]
MHSDLPLDIRLMQMATRAMLVVFAVLCLVLGSQWAVRHPGWTLQGIAVFGDTEHQDEVALRAQLANALRSRVSSSFLTVDLQQVRELFESVPWVRSAIVQREFPNRLRVTLEEHQAVAWWGQAGSGQLVSALGEVFEANPDDSDHLPELAGPLPQAGLVWSLYQTLNAELRRMELNLERLELNERGNWSALLDNGARMELGRGTPENLIERTRRFTGTLNQLTQRYPGELQSVDLRYPNGYALRLRGVTTVDGTVPPTTQNRR